MAVLLVALMVAAAVVSREARRPPPTPAPQDQAPASQSGQIMRAEMAIRADGVIGTNIQRFRNHMGRLPMSLDELTNRPETLRTDERWDGPYINRPQILIDPWGNRYAYQPPPAEGGSYQLWSLGADGIDGTDDDIGR